MRGNSVPCHVCSSRTNNDVHSRFGREVVDIEEYREVAGEVSRPSRSSTRSLQPQTNTFGGVDEPFGDARRLARWHTNSLGYDPPPRTGWARLANPFAVGMLRTLTGDSGRTVRPTSWSRCDDVVLEQTRVYAKRDDRTLRRLRSRNELNHKIGF